MRDDVINLRVARSEKTRWQRAALASDTPLSEWMRVACHRAVSAAESDAIEEVFPAMRRLANRLESAWTRAGNAEVAQQLRRLCQWPGK